MQTRPRSITAILLGVFVAAVILSSGLGTKQANARPSDEHHAFSCNNATVQGAYGFQRNGTTANGPLTAVGVAEFDGQGNTTARQEISRFGVFTPPTPAAITATYTINPDCTGAAYDLSGSPFAYLVVDHNGSEILGMSLTPGNNVAIHYERINDLPGSSAEGHDRGK